jgi:excisionase family DNA binding protein
MTKPHLPIKPQRASRGWRGSGPGDSARHVGDDRGPVGSDHNSLLVDSREVARLLGIGRTKAFQMMAREELPVVRIGRCVRVSRAGLEQWVTEQSSPVTSEPVRRAYEFER